MEEEIPLESVKLKWKYGFYACMDCVHDWESANCWPGKWQRCRLCKRKKYAYKMLPVSQIGRCVDIGPHPQHLCEKCIEYMLRVFRYNWCFFICNESIKLDSI